MASGSFLKQSDQGWAFLPLIQRGALLETAGYIPLVKTTSPGAIAQPLPGAATLGDRMALEIAAAIQAYTGPAGLYYQALHLLRIADSPFSPSLYATLASNPDPQVRFIGLAGLLAGPGKGEALAKIAADAVLIPGLRTRSLVELAIAAVRSSDPVTIQALGSLSTSSNQELQWVAAVALANIHSVDTLPLLTGLLDAADRRTRYQAIVGLSRFVDGLPIQTPETTRNFKALYAIGPTPFRTRDTDQYSLSRTATGPDDDSANVNFWKSWWLANRDRIEVHGAR